MRTVYNIKETLVVNDNDYFNSVVRDHLAWLGSCMLLDCASIVELNLTFDNDKVSFFGDNMTADYHSIIRKLDGQTSFEMELCFSYDSNMYDTKSAFSIAEYLQDEDEQDSVFYTICYYDEDSWNKGILCAYGVKDGKVYNGAVEAHTITEFPEIADWYTSRDSVVIESDVMNNFDKSNLPEVKAVCDELAEMSNYDYEMTYDGNDIVFCMYNFQPKCKADYENYIRLTQRLCALMPDDYGFRVTFVDLDDRYGRVFEINVNNENSYSLKMTCIE